MPVFAIPSARSSHLRSRYSEIKYATSRKRKRSPASPLPDLDGTTNATPSTEDEAPALSAAITNPLSLAPDEIIQYRIAGLDLDQEIPSITYPDFPHRDIVFRHDETPMLGEERGESAESPKKARGSQFLRAQHLGVLNAILHRCLREGDITRASRAWGLLLRSHVDGKPIDIRKSGYWGIGAELLMREGESHPHGSIGFGTGGQHNERSNSHQEEMGGYHEPDDTRWGSAAGFRKTREYYERLILQYPYLKHLPNSVDELDFLPAMLSCWIYGIQFEQQEALNKLSVQEKNDEIIFSDAEDSDTDINDFYASQARQEQQREDYLWRRRDSIRREALTAAEEVAARIDKEVDTPTYSDSHVLLRLRGMLALYIGDLAVPAKLGTTTNTDNVEMGNTGHQVRDRDRQWQYDHEAGTYKRKEELAKARKFFERARDRGGRVENELLELSSELEDSFGDGTDGFY